MPFVNKARRIDPNLRKTNIGLTKREKEIYTIYSNAFKGVRNQLGDQKVLRDIMDALRANSASGVNNAINWRTFLESLNRTAPALAAQMVEVANLHSKVLPKKVQYQYNFESKDPRAIAWAQTQAGKRIQGITLETQQAVSDLIADGLRTKLSRDEIVAQLRQAVGLDRRQSKALGNFYMKRLEKYLEDGLTYEEAAAKAEKNGIRYRDKLLRQRAIRIARTEISAAANAGRYLSWEEANARGLLPPDSKKRWLTNIDERTCPICQPMNGTLIPWQATFSTGDIMPPAHPNCRCTSVIVPGEIQVIKSVEKHLQGKHDQKSHGKGNKFSFSEREGSFHNFLNLSNDKGELLSSVTYSESLNQIEIEMIQSTIDNQGYATKVVDELYRRKPEKSIYWGKTIEPSSTHLAQKFSDKYGRTEFMPWGNGVIEGYQWGQIYGNPTPVVQKHAPGKHDQKTHAGGRYKNVILSEDSLRARYERDSYQFDIKAENSDWEEEEQAVNGYRDQDYDVINSYARASTTKDKQQVVREWAYGRESAETIQRKTELVDRAIDLAPRMEQNATLYRVMDTEILEKIKVGTVFKDKGFTSTTIVDLTSPSGKDMLDRLTNLNPVENKPKSVMQINNGPHTTGLFINGYLNEYTGSYAKELEMLLPREIELEYTGVENGVHMFDRLS